METFENKLENLLLNYKRKLSFIKINYINNLFFEEINYLYNGKKLFSKCFSNIINNKKKTIIIAKNKDVLLKINYFIKSKFGLNSILDLKKLSLEIEDLKFKEGEKKLINIIFVIYNETKTIARNLLKKYKKLIIFKSKEEKYKNETIIKEKFSQFIKNIDKIKYLKNKEFLK